MFEKVMKNDWLFPFAFLQCTGSGSLTLTVPSTCVHCQWTSAQVVGLCGQSGQGALYILAQCL